MATAAKKSKGRPVPGVFEAEFSEEDSGLPAVPSVVNKETGIFDPNKIQNPIQRLESFRREFPVEKFNVVEFEQFVLSRIPPGVSLYPQQIIFYETDFWDSKNAPQIGIRPGMVMLSAPALSRLGMAAGVELDMVEERTMTLGADLYFLVRFRPRMLLPDGTWLHGTPVGKAQLVKNNKGERMAHIIESTHTKAMRNAYKSLLKIPTQMPLEVAQRPFLTFRAVYDTDVPEAKEIADRISARAEAAKSTLYGSPVQDVETVEAEQATPEPVAVTEKQPGDFQSMKKNLASAESEDRLMDIGNQIAEYEWTSDQHKVLAATYRMRHAELELEAGQ